MWPAVLLVIYCLLIVLASLGGGWLPSLMRITHTRMQAMMSLVSGLMLGVALMHMLPHAVQMGLPITNVSSAMLCGLLAMFFLMRIFHVHQHDDVEDDHRHCDHGHDHQHHVSWVGLFLGLAVHTLLDGVALGASVAADSRHAGELSLCGIGTFLAVVLHKPLDALAITSLMRASAWSNKGRLVVNCGFALMCPCGALLFWIGAEQSLATPTTIGYALAFSAGFFLCIALSDLLPEVAFHSHDRVKLSAALLLGVGLALAIELSHSH